MRANFANVMSCTINPIQAQARDDNFFFYDVSRYMYNAQKMLERY